MAHRPAVASPSHRSLAALPTTTPVHLLVTILLIVGMLLTQVLMGGFSLFFAIPGYCLIGLASILAITQSRKKLHTGVSTLAILSTLAMVGYVVWRSLTSPVEYLARMDFHMVLASLAVYLITACYLRSARHRMWVVFSMFGIAVLHVIAGVLQFVQGQHFMLMWLWPDGWLIPKLFRPDYGWRASGFYGCPNHLAGFLETLGMLALAFCLLGRGKVVARILFAYFLLTCLLGIAITGSRGGYLSTTGGIAVFFALTLWVVYRLRRKKFWVSLVAVAVVASLAIGTAYVAMSTSLSIQRRLEHITDQQDVRFKLWPAAIKQYKESPVIGTGSGTYLYYGRQFREAAVQRDPVHVHNDYLELLGEYGIIGAVAVGIFIIIHIWSGARGLQKVVRRRLRPADRILSDELALIIGSLAAAAIMLAHSVVDFNFHVPGNTLFYAFIFGMLASPSSDPKIAREQPQALLRPMRFALPALGGVILWAGLPLMRAEYHTEWARVQLRNIFFVDTLYDTQSQVSLLMASSAGMGTPLPAVSAPRDWADHFYGYHYLPKALAHAKLAEETERKNPNLYYYLGEILRYQSLFLREDSVEKPRDVAMRELRVEATKAYGEGLKLFPQDARLQLKFAQMLDSLGALEAAETVYMDALRADPNLGEIYARYGAHLFLRKQLLRAEAYYRRAMKFSDGNDIAEAGLEDIARLRARAKDPKFVDQFGDPLELFEMDPPTEEDEKRGAVLHD